MFEYLKRLQYPVKITNPNPTLAKFIISQYGGPDGELAASLRYLSQRYSMPYPELKALLTDIGLLFPQMYKIITSLASGSRRGPLFDHIADKLVDFRLMRANSHSVIEVTASF
jgi:spore coat protein JC